MTAGSIAMDWDAFAHRENLGSSWAFLLFQTLFYTANGHFNRNPTRVGGCAPTERCRESVGLHIPNTFQSQSISAKSICSVHSLAITCFRPAKKVGMWGLLHTCPNTGYGIPYVRRTQSLCGYMWGEPYATYISLNSSWYTGWPGSIETKILLRWQAFIIEQCSAHW